MNRLADYLPLHALRTIPIRYRLAAAFVLLALLPLGIAATIAHNGSNAAIAARTRALSTEVLKQVARNIAHEMARLEADSEALVLSDRVQHALARYAGGDQMQMTAARDELTRALLERYGPLGYINQKYLLDSEDRIIDAQVFASLARGVVRFVAQAPKLQGRPHWGAYDNADGQKSLVLLRAVYDKAGNRMVGHLFLGVRPSHFSSIFEDVMLGGGSAVSVFDADAGSVVAKVERLGAAPDAPPGAALAEALRRGLQRNQRSGVVDTGSELVAYAQVADTGWCVLATMPHGALAEEIGSVRNKSFLIGLAALIAALLLARRFTS